MTARLAAALGLAAALAAAAWAGGAAAQTAGLGTGSGQPIEVYADNGIEWHRDETRYVARGNARAVQGDTTVFADTLIAHYRERPGADNEIYRLDAEGNVRIVLPTATAYGDHGAYDMKKKVLVLRGDNLRMVTSEEVVTARDSLEYWKAEGLAVARGNAVLRSAVKGEDRTVRADVLTAHFAKAPEKAPGAGSGADAGAGAGGGRGETIDRMEAFGNVVVTRPGEIARAARGVYLPKRDVANLWGDVKITRGQSQINGQRATVNFRTGVSRMLAAEVGKPGGPVRALIVPEEPAQAPAGSAEHSGNVKE